ncbi:uncharacterized protein LOC120633789 [Pararge aegeria]|uniref:Jg14585 protein n=1 Tax=Pararge aegeria aegeria TaxID=348720 RepID=A0A8S4QX84_9NEOP|nr:uncharacterized protein LOC120633789 [Pararge aegeria]CAH2227181.1 jg14585 [Pararge aegeria aegeria]
MGTKCKKILEEIHPLSIIREVQKWPVLYVKDNPERANLHFKNKVWNEIAKALFTDWETYTDWEKESKVTDLMKKWRNLRDTFKRQLEAEKKIREGHNIKKKTYVYFKHMLYLLPHIAPSENGTSDPVVEPKLNEFFTRQAKRKGSEKKKSLKKKKRLDKHATIKSVIIPDLPSKSTDKEEMIDEDKHFLMSLVPSFKRMSDDEKLEAKVEILKVIKGIRRKTLETAVESSSVADSLSYNLEETDLSEVKIEMISGEADDCESQSNSSESGDSENSE